MQYRMLGTTGLEISAIGFGAWAIGGGGWVEGWGPQDDNRSIGAIHRALDRGINWIDTAGAYGLGHSEVVIERALRGLAERPLVFTKCTSTWDAAGNISSRLDADSIRREVEDSLRRLRVEVLDLCQLHMPVPDRQIEEGWATLAALRDEGKLKHIGVSNFDVPQMRRCEPIAHVESLQPIYSLLNAELEDELLPYTCANGVGVVVYSPMASGLLTGRMTRERIATLPAEDWRSRWPDFQEPRLSESMRVVDVVREIAERRDCAPGQVAIAWTLRTQDVAGATVGFRDPEQVDDLAAAGDLALDAEEVALLDAARPATPLFSMGMEGEVRVDDLRA
jgi:aryl-alcohol dehydrogenase-like predicted oxidoreductase